MLNAATKGDPPSATFTVVHPCGTFLFAGLSKLLDTHYLDGASPLGVHAQMVHAAATSPIGPLVLLAADHATVAGLAIAFGEIAVGLGQTEDTECRITEDASSWPQLDLLRQRNPERW